MHVVRVWLVPCVKPHERVWFDAADLVAVNAPYADEMLALIRDAEDVPPGVIEGVRVDVQPTPILVREDEVAVSSVVAGMIDEAERGQQAPERAHLRMRNRDVEIVVGPRLGAQECVDGPAAVHVHVQALTLEPAEEVDDITGSHRADCSCRSSAALLQVRCKPVPTPPRLIVDYGLLAYLGAIADVSSHDCSGTVVALGLEREFELTLPDRVARVRAAVVPPGRPRSVDGGGGRMAVCVVDPDLRVSMPSAPDALLTLAQELAGAHDLTRWPAFRFALGLTARSRSTDQRIAAVTAQIRGSTESTPPIGELAASVQLSASRLAHLFTEHVGCPIRSYRMWCRFRAAALAFGAGANITGAAQTAGFYDSAQFARMFRQSFGLAPSAVLTRDLVVRVIED